MESIKRYKILVIDDLEFAREMISQSIKSVSPDIATDKAENGNEAKRMIEANPYDLILCDWEMPDIKGSELLQWLRQHPVHKNIPFIMVTANNRKEHIMESIRLGVNDYITKPFTPALLAKKVEVILRKTHRH